MVYPEYEEYKRKYQFFLNRFNQILSKKEDMLMKTLPSAIRYDKDHVQSSPSSNVLDEYVIALDESQIDSELSKVKELIEDRGRLLDLKEKQLRDSGEINDRIYVMKYLDGYGIGKIAKVLNYSRSQVYRVLDKISKRCDKMRQNMC